MATKIKFVKVYPFCKSVMADIVYKSGRMFTTGLAELPGTAQEFIFKAKAERYWHPLEDRHEIIYTIEE